jgi:urease beta subunit
MANIPGQIFFADGDIEINAGRRTVTLTVKNTGDRAAQIGSHFHFFEVNRALEFDRPQAMGMHLNIAAGTSVRFEPGQERVVELVEYAGMKRAIGFNMLTMGSTTGKWDVKVAIDKANELDFKSVPEGAMEAEAKAAAAAAKRVTRGTTGANMRGPNSARQAGDIYRGPKHAGGGDQKGKN